VNSLEQACLNHDVAYAVHKDTAALNAADDCLVAGAAKIAISDDAPEYEKQDARTVAAIMAAKSPLKLGVSTAKRCKARGKGRLC